MSMPWMDPLPPVPYLRLWLRWHEVRPRVRVRVRVSIRVMIRVICTQFSYSRVIFSDPVD